MSRPPDLRSERIKDRTDPNSPPDDYPHIWGIVSGARRGRISRNDFRRIQKSRNWILATSRPPDLRSERIKDRTNPVRKGFGCPRVRVVILGSRRGQIPRNDFAVHPILSKKRIRPRPGRTRAGGWRRCGGAVAEDAVRRCGGRARIGSRGAVGASALAVSWRSRWARYNDGAPALIAAGTRTVSRDARTRQTCRQVG